MILMEAIRERHSVRRYTGKNVEQDRLAALQAETDAANAESGLHIRLVADDPDSFSGLFARFNFSEARNFIVLCGKESPDLEARAGYYGERLVLRAQQLGLNSCWAATLSGRKFAASIGRDEKIVITIVFGYGVTQGAPRKTKPLESLCRVDGEMPAWFRLGMEAALLAPTARNQQKFLFTLSGGRVKAESTGGAFSQIGLGIAKYHFEIGAGAENFKWAT